MEDWRDRSRETGTNERLRGRMLAGALEQVAAGQAECRVQRAGCRPADLQIVSNARLDRTEFQFLVALICILPCIFVRLVAHSCSACKPFAEVPCWAATLVG